MVILYVKGKKAVAAEGVKTRMLPGDGCEERIGTIRMSPSGLKLTYREKMPIPNPDKCDK